jgi:hypothetical protein
MLHLQLQLGLGLGTLQFPPLIFTMSSMQLVYILPSRFPKIFKNLQALDIGSLLSTW